MANTLPCSECGTEVPKAELIATGDGNIYCIRHHPIAHTEDGRLIVSLQEALNLRGAMETFEKMS